MKPYVLWILLLLLAGSVLAESYVPGDDSEVLERLPWQADDPLRRELRELRAELSANPASLSSAVRVARRYVALARGTGDPRYNGYAEAALAPWWSEAEPPSDVLFLRAVLRQHTHDFETALADLSRLLQRDPRYAEAWLQRAAIQQVQGDYESALRSCRPLARLAPPLVATACAGQVAALTGRARQGYAMLRRAVEAYPEADAGLRLWVLTGLAETAARLGEPGVAEEHFQEALALGRRDVYLLAAYADFLLDRERPGDVVALLGGDIRADALLLRLALAEARLGTPKLGEHVETLKARFAAARLRGQGLHQADEARFHLYLLKEPAAALRLAQENWKVQREPADTRILLASALAAGAPEAAREAIGWLARTGLEDVELAKLVKEISP